MNFRQPRIEIPKIREAARGEDCTIRHPEFCNANPETTVYAHDNWDKPVGGKNDDLCGAFACSGCHEWLDTTRDPERLPMFWRAHKRTLRRLWEKGVIK